MSENTSRKRKLLPPPRHYGFILFLQFLASAFVILFAISYLPVIYLVGVTALCALLLMLTSMMTLSYYNNWMRVCGKVLSLVLSIALITGSFMIQKGDTTVTKVADNNKKVIAVSVVVMNTSSAESLKDVKDGVIGYNKDYDGSLAGKVKSAIKSKTKTTPKLDAYTQYKYLADGLYEGSADAIFFNETYRAYLEQGYPDFSTETKILTTFNIEVEEKMASTAVEDVTKDCFVVYISGIDTRGKITGTRSDSNMLVIVNPTTHQVLLLGIPRDYYVTLHSIGQKDKLTHSGLFGVQETVNTLQDLLDIEVNYYVRVNFKGAIDMIDAVGGVDVYSPVAFTTVSDKYQIAKGKNHMNGKKALYFMRSRKMLAGGDNDRVTNQIRVVKALMKKLMSYHAITNYNDILNVVSDNVQTNMTTKEIKKLFRMQLKQLPDWDIQNYQLSGTNDTTTEAYMTRGVRTYVMQPDEDVVNYASNLVKTMLKDGTITVDDDNSYDPNSDS